MSRLDSKFVPADDTPLDPAEILAALEAQAATASDRQDAISRYLSGADGWRDASQQLGGAFAEPPAGQRLRRTKEP